MKNERAHPIYPNTAPDIMFLLKEVFENTPSDKDELRVLVVHTAASWHSTFRKNKAYMQFLDQNHEILMDVMKLLPGIGGCMFRDSKGQIFDDKLYRVFCEACGESHDRRNGVRYY